MKRILLTLAILAVLTLPALAQTPIYGPQSLGLWTNFVAASTARAVTNVVDCAHQRNVTFQFLFKGDDAGGTVTFAFKPSVDGTTYADAVIPITLGNLAVAGTTVVTNIDTFGYGYLKLVYITNAHASANITNVTVSYGVKISSP